MFHVDAVIIKNWFILLCTDFQIAKTDLTVRLFCMRHLYPTAARPNIQ
jgi:hypothetical protein